jgi:type IV pilus secretin PilQ/predicted competence protein
MMAMLNIHGVGSRELQKENAMKKLLKEKSCVVNLMVGLAFFAAGQRGAMAQEGGSPGQEVQDDSPPAAEFVTINVKDANISEVLKAYSLQTGQSIVIGPDVISENVNVSLNNIPWQEALDVTLKPYGFGYRVVGETIVVDRLENMVSVEGIEPLASKVFTLKYLDAYDIREVCEAQLTGRGKISILSNKGLPGWEFGGGSSSGRSASRAASTLGSAQRRKAEPIEKSKTIIVTDVPSSITAIEGILEELDRLPSQVLIESRFMEIGTDALLDLGLDFATGANGLTESGVQIANPDRQNAWGVEQNDSSGLTPAAFDPLAESLSGQIPYNSGLQLLFSRVEGGTQFELLLHALEEDGDVNILSAPKVLTLDNQEAAILVGEKFPIIESDSTGSGTLGGNVSTSLDYYENIGIQLNVIPQVCDNEYINMIVHPVVSEIDGFVSGVVSTSGDSGALTQYPRLKIREAQTQILLKSEDSAVIGGLQNERERESIHKVPILGDIPYLGRLFRRETTKSEKIDLLIFIKATIIDQEAYAGESARLKERWEIETGMGAASTPVPSGLNADEKELVAYVEELNEPRIGHGSDVEEM